MPQVVAVLKDYISRYDVLNRFSDEIGQVLVDMGYDVLEISVAEPSACLQELRQVLSQKDVLFVFSMSGVTLNFPQIYPVFDEFKVPIWAFYVDHPMYQEERLNVPIRYHIASFIAEEHLDYFRSQVSADTYACVVPHGAIRTQRQNTPFERRPIEVLVAGTYSDYNLMRQNLKQLPQNVQVLMNLVMEQMIQSDSLPLFQAFEDITKSMGIAIKEFEHTFIRQSMLYMDKLLRGLLRERILSSITDVPIHVFGEGWENASLPANVVRLPSVPYEKIVSLMRQTKIVLDIHPYIQGAHERTFQAMHEGAAILTVDTPYTRNNFRNAISAFRPREGMVNHQISSLLANPSLLEQRANMGEAIVQNGHMWSHRVQLMIEHVKRFLDSVE
ncbi:glycosyltransferase [Alicyclobacillus ferrooxydans]|uniref:Spore protein YkvP/CgeB glycosyl transferase-like domain-containing protein n=1 Tax=Alicyclobacillus ferrooxydans TaxID=471514 RepID=A0A0P9CNE6_9BACL|nr:glycosyltransferase [Alicyclobacillus ferrooxydans]KPV44416.1 hypothetical protein AN477_07280 [Alicyclobacillus ferrooxydans]